MPCSLLMVEPIYREIHIINLMVLLNGKKEFD